MQPLDCVFLTRKAGQRDLVSHIEPGFSIPLQFLWSSCCDSGGLGHDRICHLLTFTATSLPRSVAEISQIREQQRFVTEVESDRDGEDERRKASGCRNCVGLGVEEILT